MRAPPVPNARVLLLFLLALGIPEAVRAQTALIVFGHGGYYGPLSDLSDASDDIAPRFGLGGGFGLQLGNSVAIRLSGTFVTTRYRGDALAVSDSSMTRTLGMAELQAGWPGTSTIVPYILLGAGVVRSDFEDPSVETTLYAAGRVGGGINFVSPVGAFFVEAHMTAYRWTGVPFSKTQFDAAIQAGLAVAISLGG